MKFREERGIGHCGLACVLCSDENCIGCKANGANGEGCSVSKSAMEKKLDGCYACADYSSCEEGMLQGKRNKAFNRYAQEFGEPALIERLRVNYENGITYHTPDKSPGDYDVLETEDEIYQLLRYGRNDPYAKCPGFETKHFKFRQVQEKDAEDLLSFYGDLGNWMFYGNDMCKSIFASRYATVEEMKHCIRVWLDEYRNKYYIRFSVVDKTTEKAIGTIELFDNIGKRNPIETVRLSAVLHIDFSVPYETQEYISELLSLANAEFFKIFGVKHLLIRAVPTAKERIMALLSAGYEPFEWETGREHYYIK